MQVEIIGRAKLEIKNDSFATIFIKDKLEDDFTTVPRPVKHVGTKKYCMQIWNKIKQNRSKYESNPRTLDDLLKGN